MSVDRRVVERIQSQASLLATGTGPGQSALASVLRIMQTPANRLHSGQGMRVRHWSCLAQPTGGAFAAAAPALLAQSVHRRGADVLGGKTIPQDFSRLTAIIPAGALTTAHLMLPGAPNHRSERCTFARRSRVWAASADACLTTSQVVPDKSFSRMSFSCAGTVVACLFADSSVVASELQSIHGYNVKGAGPMLDKKHIFGAGASNLQLFSRSFGKGGGCCRHDDDQRGITGHTPGADSYDG